MQRQINEFLVFQQGEYFFRTIFDAISCFKVNYNILWIYIIFWHAWKNGVENVSWDTFRLVSWDTLFFGYVTFVRIVWHVTCLVEHFEFMFDHIYSKYSVILSSVSSHFSLWASRRERKTERGVSDHELLLNAIKSMKIHKTSLRKANTSAKKRKKKRSASSSSSSAEDEPACDICHEPFETKPTARNSYVCMGHKCYKLACHECAEPVLRCYTWTCKDCDSDDDLWQKCNFHIQTPHIFKKSVSIQPKFIKKRIVL